jgi:methyl-accepting chemotaxis protein
MLDFLTRPIRSILGVAGDEVIEEVLEPVRETREIEAHILDAVEAIHGATASIEQHVAVIETLATSVAPLTSSVDRLTDTMQDLVRLLAPMGEAEQGVQRVEHFFGWRHRKQPDDHAKA